LYADGVVMQGDNDELSGDISFGEWALDVTFRGGTRNKLCRPRWL